MENGYPKEIQEACKIFPGSTHIEYEYRWFNKYTGATYENLPATANTQDYRRQRRLVLTAYTGWENRDEEV